MAIEQFNVAGIFGDNGAWTNTVNWDGTALPGDNDRVLIRNTSFDLTTLTGQGDIDLERLEFDKTCKHKIGGSGDRLTIDVQSDAVAGDGPGYLIYAGTGTEAWFTVDTKKFIARHTGFGANACVVKHRTNDIDEYVVENGYNRLDGGIYVLVSLTAAGNRSARLVIDAGSTLTTLVQSGGLCECSTLDTLETCTVSGGEFQHLAAQAVTTLNLHAEGVFRFDGEATIATVNMYGGYLDLSRTAVPKVITTFNGHGGTLDLRGAGVPKFTTIWASDSLRVLGLDKFRTF